MSMLILQASAFLKVIKGVRGNAPPLTFRGSEMNIVNTALKEI